MATIVKGMMLMMMVEGWRNHRMMMLVPMSTMTFILMFTIITMIMTMLMVIMMMAMMMMVIMMMTIMRTMIMMMMVMMMVAGWRNLLLEDLRAGERMKGCPSTPLSALKYQDDGDADDGDDADDADDAGRNHDDGGLEAQ